MQSIFAKRTLKLIIQLYCTNRFMKIIQTFFEEKTGQQKLSTN